MSESSKPERPEEVRDGAPGGDATDGHEQRHDAERVTPAASDTPSPDLPPTQSPTPAAAPPVPAVEQPVPAVEQPVPAAEQPVPAAEQPVPEAEDVPAADEPAASGSPQNDAEPESPPAPPEEVTPERVTPEAADVTPAAAPGADATTAPEPSDDAAPDHPPAPSSAQAEVTASAPTETPVSVDEGATTTVEAKGGEKAKGKSTPKRAPRRERKAPAKAPRPALSAEQRTEAREHARERFLRSHAKQPETAAAALDLVLTGASLVYLARFHRLDTGGMDLRSLRQLREEWLDFVHDEERRIELREVLRSHGALDEKTQQRLHRASTVPAMEDVAAPHLPVVAGRATMARGLGLEPLAEAIREGKEGTVLSELAKEYVKEGEEPTGIDGALAGARDILAEEMCLDAELRARLRKIFRREAIVAAALRAERKGDPGRHKSLVGFQAPASKVPPLKFLMIRRAEKERVLVSTIEPPEEALLPTLHRNACPETHLHAGFLRAAMEDGYRRILKPLFQMELRGELKRRADAAATETFERNLKHRLLGPVGGPRATLGLRPDVTGGHHWCAIDSRGLPTGCGTLPHEGTAGRDACLAELREVVKTYEAEAIAVGSGAGRAAARSLADEVVLDAQPPIDVATVTDGGTHALEAQGKLEVGDRPEISAECRGAYSLARRFQDPLRELVAIDPKALALGPHLHDVHQGRLRTALDETVEACVAHVGVDANSATEDLLARVPGFTRHAARAFVAWRDAHGPLLHKAALAAVPAVGTEVAEQAVGFLRLPDAEDRRDRTLLHPAQYDLVERMAAQVGADVPALFGEQALRQKVQLQALEGESTPLPLLRHVLYEVASGHVDERPRFARPLPPPPGLTLETLQPGLLLDGRVIRAMPFGVFVDVGLETDALIPTPHIGEHPGVEPATVAPIGAVIQARVLEVIPEKKRLTLTMRPDRFLYDRGPRGPRGGGRGGPPRGRDDRPTGRGGDRGGAQGGRGGERRGAPAGAGPSTGPGAQAGRGGQGARGAQGGRGTQGGRGGDRGRPARKPQGKSGRFGGSGGIGDIFSGRRRDDRGTPKRISLSADEGREKEAEPQVDEKNLTPEELLQRKLADLRRKFEGDKK